MQNNVGIYASQISGHLYDGPFGAYDSLATVTVPSGGAASITFTGIPSGYKHLQLRFFAGTNRAAPISRDTFKVQFNGDTAANYSYHEINGDGASVAVSGNASTNFIVSGTAGGGGFFGAAILDILEYTNTNTYKTIRSLSGVSDNTGGYGLVDFRSGNWRSTSAITSMTLSVSVGTAFTEYSQAALYGVK
jgi:hypothetical protein